MFSFSSELGVFASWREEYPNSRVFDFQKICASYDNFQGW